MKFEWLKEIIGENYTEEVDKKVAAKIGENFVARADFNVTNEAKKALEAQLKDRDKDMTELKKAAGDNTELNKRYQELQDKYKTDMENLSKTLTKKLNDAKKDSAIDMAIVKAKGINPKAIKALLDMDKITLKDDGTLEGLDLEAFKKAEGWMFETEEVTRTGTGYQRGETSRTVDTSKMNYSQLCEYMANNKGI